MLLKFHNNGRSALALWALCTAVILTQGVQPVWAQDGEVTENFDPSDPVLISAPIIIEPLYECSEVIAVTGVIPGADLEVFINTPTSGGATVTLVAQDDPVVVNVPALSQGDVVVARQIFDGMMSDDSAEAIVGSVEGVTVNEPRVNPPPLYECGRRTGSFEHLPGSNVTFFSQPFAGSGSFTSIGGGGAPTSDTTYFTLSPQFSAGEAVTTQYELCGIVSPMSGDEIVQPEPGFIPEPLIDEEVYPGMTTVDISGLYNGAEVIVYKNGTNSSDIIGSRYTGASRTKVWFSPISDTDVLYVSQQLCNSSRPVTPVPVKPCSQLSAPIIRTPEIGDDFVIILEAVAGARIQVFDASGIHLADGAGERIALNRAIRPGDTLFVRQIAGDCVGRTWWQTDAVCKKTDEHADPSADGPFGVGQFDYSLGDITVGSTDTRVAAHVRFPTTPGVSKEPAQWGGQFPIVFILHGNHGIWRNPERNYEDKARDLCPDRNDPERGPRDMDGEVWNIEVENHRGYDEVMNALARRGYIAVSIDGNDLNCRTDHIEERAELILAHIELWIAIHNNGGQFELGDAFQGRVDMQDVGILGHSRGGEAAVRAAELAQGTFSPVDEANVSGVLSVAPTDFHKHVLERIPLLVMLPAADGDVRGNNGAKIYDRARSGGSRDWFRSQQYIYGANHNFFNSEWGYDDKQSVSGSMGPALVRAQQEEILRMMARGFFDLTLYAESWHKGFLTGDAILSGLPAEIYPSYSRSGALNIDLHQDGDPFTNTLGEAVFESGFASFDEDSFSGGYNGTFFHEEGGLLVVWEEPASFSSEVFRDVSAYEYLSVRVTQTLDPLNASYGPASTSTGFSLDSGGAPGRVSSSEIGEIPYPYEFGDWSKSMMHTMRVPTACLSHLAEEGKPVDLQGLERITIDTDMRNSGVLGFDALSFTN